LFCVKFGRRFAQSAAWGDAVGGSVGVASSGRFCPCRARSTWRTCERNYPAICALRCRWGRCPRPCGLPRSFL